MKCDCKFPPRDNWSSPYEQSYKFINRDMKIIDIGCNDGKQLLELKKHMKTHNINVYAVGIDILTSEELYSYRTPEGLEHLGGYMQAVKKATLARSGLDEFINNSAQDANPTGADLLLYFGFSPSKKERVACYKNLVGFLNPGGRAYIDVMQENKWLWFAKIFPFLYRYFSHHLERRLLSKNELASHVKKCVRKSSTVRNCNHGITHHMVK